MGRANGAPMAHVCAQRATLLVAIAIASAGVVSCGGHDEATRTTPASASAASSSATGEALVAIAPPPPPADVQGASAAIEAPAIPVDVTELGSRMAPRSLAIPRVRSGRSARFVFDGHHRGWFARLPESTRANPLSPVYGGDRVIVGGGFTSNTVYGFDAREGTLVYRASAPDGGPTASIVEDDKVLFNTESCTLFAIDLRTGRQLWSRWLGDPLMSQPSAANGRVFSGHIRDGGGYGFTAMDLSSGRVRWTRSIPADVLNAAVLDGDDVFFTTMNGWVYRMEQASGRVVWRERLDATSAPWLDGQSVHVTRRQRVVDDEGQRAQVEVATVLSREDGAIVREHESVHADFLPSRPDVGGVEAGWSFEGSRPTIAQGRSYQTIGDEVHARDAETGALLWRRRYADVREGGGRARVRPASAPAIAGGLLVFGTREGILYGLDVDTGLTAWAYDVGEPIGSQPTVAHGWVYATTTRGGLVGLEVGDDDLDGWHMWGGNASHAGPVVGDVATPEPDERPSEGVLRLGGSPRAGELGGFPLQSTRVSAQVSGFVARVEVEQTFTNPYERPVEATYLFPLPHDAAVDAMQMRAGSRVVHALIHRRQEARARYEDARERGVLTSLLEQERADLFRQSVANIRPGDSVSVTLSYTLPLRYEEGAYRFVYPLVSAPRYEPQREEPSEAGAPQLVLAPGGERPDRVEVSIRADMGVALREVSSPTHELRTTREGQDSVTVSLAEAARPDRDLEVRFVVAGDAPSIAAMTSAPVGEEAGHVALAIHPRLDVDDAEVLPREVVVALDASSSMHGGSFALARDAALAVLDGLREGDSFRVIAFSDSVRALDESALPASPGNVERARAMVRALAPLGATEMVPGVQAALEPAGEAGRLRMVVLLTDGWIGNESEVLRAIEGSLGDARVFALGVGSAPNRHLLARLSEVGRGASMTLLPGEDPSGAAARLRARIDRPYLTDVEIAWEELGIHDVYPRRLPDLFADQPLVLHGRYDRGAEGDVTIRGRIGGRPWEGRVHVALPAAQGQTRAELASIWARTRIADLMLAMALRPAAPLVEEVTQLGLTHHLMTQYTSFVAIDEGYRAEGEAVSTEIPSMLPAGTEAQPMAGATRVLRGARMAGTAVGSSGSSSIAPSRPMPTDVDELLAGGLGGGRSAARGLSMELERRVRTPDEGATGAERGDTAAAASPEPTAAIAARCRAAARQEDGTIDAAAFARCMADARRRSEVLDVSPSWRLAGWQPGDFPPRVRLVHARIRTIPAMPSTRATKPSA